MIKRPHFDKLPAPDSVIKQVETLAGPNGASPSLLFTNQHRVPFDWPDNPNLSSDIDFTHMAAYPDVPAEMLGMALTHHTTMFDTSSTLLPSQELDWSQLAIDATRNADLDVAEHLPPPPDVIDIDDDNGIIYAPPHNVISPFIKKEPVAKKDSTTQMIAPSQPHHASTRTKCLPNHLDDYHLFTTVAAETRLPQAHPYHMVGGTDVDLAT